MKIAILTLPLHTNYGGILQAYALQTVLERIGHEAYVLQCNVKRRIHWKDKPIVYLKRFIKKYLLRRNGIVIFEEKWWNNVGSIAAKQNTQKFIDRYINSYYIEYLSELKENDFDVYIVGSDQVWRPKYFNGKFHSNIEDAYLNFAKTWNVKRIAYAASFGVEKWEYTQRETTKCRKLLSLFDAVSVREESAVSNCRKYFNIEAQYVLDPTMLLSCNDYIEIFQKSKTPRSSGNLLCYILDMDPYKESVISNIAETLHKIPFSVNGAISVYPKAEVKPSVEQWLRGFYDAEFVITDSFHACAFSIIFRKQFIVLANKGRGMSRIISLLNIFNLEDRIVTSTSTYKELKDIDYDNVHKNLASLRTHSIRYLTQIK